MRNKLITAMLCLAMCFTTISFPVCAQNASVQAEETDESSTLDAADESEVTNQEAAGEEAEAVEDESVDTEDEIDETQEDVVETQSTGTLANAYANADLIKINQKSIFNFGSDYDLSDDDGLSYMFKYKTTKTGYYQFTLHTTKGKVNKYTYTLYSYDSSTGKYTEVLTQTAGSKVSYDASKYSYTPTDLGQAVLYLTANVQYYVQIKANDKSFSVTNPRCYFILKKHSHSTKDLTKKADNGGKYVMRKCTDFRCTYKKAVSFSVTTAVKSVKAFTEGFTVTWNKKSEATGYQVLVSTSSKFTTYTPYKYDGDTTSAKFEGLTARKKYYVKIRCYYEKSDLRFFSKYCTAKAITTKGDGTQATIFLNMTTKQFLAYAGPLCTADQKKTGILASVTLAQMILESGWGKSGLTQNANNCFGIKVGSSKTMWTGGGWDGKSYYTTKTQEEYNGKTVTITDSFRKYDCVEDSIADHSAYLLYAKNGTKLRYDGIKGETSYKKAFTIIKSGGYATSSTYVSSLCKVVETYNLTQYDVK